MRSSRMRDTGTINSSIGRTEHSGLDLSVADYQAIEQIDNVFRGALAPTTTMHGVLVDVYGVGVLLVGQSSIGKSETALELVKRGHRLVADDAVEIRQTQENQLIGSAPELIQHLLEIRGVGIINVMTLFGAVLSAIISEFRL